ncbi:MAG: transcriptional repressor [Clostridia bacterium]|nr:transcriptional repressor [Clostridia bacterium]
MDSSKDRKEYVTGNKSIVKDFFQKNSDSHFSVEAVIRRLEEDGYDIGKSSVYRIVGNLCKSGVIRRFEAPGIDNFVYQYSNFDAGCESHFHLKCTKCGKLVHLECDELQHLKEHIKKEHGFIIGGNGIINGICEGCYNR